MRGRFRHAVLVADIGDGAAERWIERRVLLRLVRRDVRVSGDEPVEVVLTQEPDLLVAVSNAALPALDLQTYQVRLQRWEDGRGPRLTGIREFVYALETLTEPTRAATVSGAVTTYTFLLDAELSRVLAAVAVDSPSAV